MIEVNIFEIKAKLSEYVDRALQGERIVICRHNKPVAELRALDVVRADPRPIGPLPGRPTFEISASFFEPMSADELNMWEGIAATDPLSPAWVPRPVGGASKVAEKKGTLGPRPPRRRARRRP